MVQTDFLVVGSGIAGLSYALKVAQYFPDKKVLVITKTRIDETNTKYAQGGIAGVTDLEHDSYDKHIQDTLVAGDGLCNPRTVEIVVKEGPERIKEIIEWGTRFDKDAEGDYKLGREGGTRSSASCITKMLPARRSKEPCWKPSENKRISRSASTGLSWTLSRSTILAI